MARKAFLVALLACISGCAAETVEAGDFINGERKLTDDAAFAVELWHEDGQPVVGENDFTLRVEFPDPGDPSHGMGIPAARIGLDCWMPNADHAMAANPMVIPGPAGDYRLAHIVLDEAGVWQFDFEIAVGEKMVETVSYAFTVDE